MNIKATRYIRRKLRVRSKIFGTKELPRFSVFRSNSHIYGQIIDDVKGKTLVSASDLTLKSAKGKKSEIAGIIGEEIAKKAIAAKIKKVVFDRNGLQFHGRVKAVAEGARKGGLVF